jgi:ATP-binding cassette, subfamily B, bacterial
MQREEQGAAEQPPVRFWTTILSFVKPYRGRLVISMVCAAVVGVTVALQPIVVKWIIDNGVLRTGSDGQLLPLDERLRRAVLFVGAYFLLSAIRMSVGVTGVMHMIGGIERFICDLRARFFRHVQRACHPPRGRGGGGARGHGDRLCQ